MRLTQFEARAYRNIAHARLEPCHGVNIIHGDNGQGKTNLLEGIWLMTGCRSFRCADFNGMIQEGESAATLEAAFISNEREQTASLDLAPKKRALHLNGFAEDTPRRMLGVFPAVAFTPATLALVQGGPGERRRFLDIALSMRTPAYAVRLSKYIKALAQRNALLRNIGANNSMEDMLDAWDISLARDAAQISKARQAYFDLLLPRAQDFYAGISGGRETFGGAYHTAGTRDISEEGYLAALRHGRARDLRLQMTHPGPHRDDLHLHLDGKSLREFGSQGQQRSAALAMKLAEAAVLFEATGERPVALLDDVLSELDPRRQADLLQYLAGWQVFLTTCDTRGAASRLASSCGEVKMFHVEQGKLDIR